MRNFILALAYLGILLAASSAFADEPVYLGVDSHCGLEKYISNFNARHPEKEMLIEDVTQIVLADSKEPAKIRIDKDEVSGFEATQVIQCMTGTFTSFQGTLQKAFEVYFTQKRGRRAMWLFFSELDNMYFSKEQRTGAIQRHDSYLVNGAEAAAWGTWVTALGIWAVRRGKGPLPSTGMVTAARAAFRTDGLTGVSKLVYNGIRSFVPNFTKFTAAAGSTGLVVGGGITAAKQFNLITTWDKLSTDIIELTYHRMHWLELDCRARQIKANLGQSEHQYKEGAKDPLFRSDVRDMNYLVNDFNFLTDVSQLYYSEREWPSEMKWDANNVSYKDMTIACPAGFSSPDIPSITAIDVRASIKETAGVFLERYSALMSKPVAEKIKAFMDKNQKAVQEIVDKNASPLLKTFLQKVKTAGQAASTSDPKNMIQTLAIYAFNPNRTEGRDVFLKQWIELLQKFPKELATEMDQLTRDAVGLLPPALMNQLILDQFALTDSYPANLIFLFNLGITLDNAAKEKMIANKSLYVMPDEYMFYLFGNLKEAKQ